MFVRVARNIRILDDVMEKKKARNYDYTHVRRVGKSGKST